MNMVQVISRGCDAAVRADPKTRGMSDDQRDLEWAAQKRFYAAIDEMHKAIEFVNHNSAVTQINVHAFIGFIHDETLTDADWDEKISEARTK